MSDKTYQFLDGTPISVETSANGFIMVSAVIGNQLEKHRYFDYSVDEAVQDFMERFPASD